MLSCGSSSALLLPRMHREAFSRPQGGSSLLRPLVRARDDRALDQPGAGLAFCPRIRPVQRIYLSAFYPSECHDSPVERPCGTPVSSGMCA
jgi:hypothetical protein